MEREESQEETRRGPEPSDGRLREVIPVEGEGTLFVVLDLGSITVEAHDEPVVSINAVASGWAASSFSFAVQRSGADIEISGELDEWLPGLFGGVRARVRVKVPKSFALDAHTGGGTVRARDLEGRIAIDTLGGSVEVEGAAGPVLATTAGGSIRMRQVRGDVRVRTAGGSIALRDVDGCAEVRTLGGAIRASNLGGELDARTAAGPISASFRGDPVGTLKTSAGPIEVRMPREAGAELDAKSGAGGVHIDRNLIFEGERRGSRAQGRLGGGGPVLVLRSAAGGIRVRERHRTGEEG